MMFCETDSSVIWHAGDKLPFLQYVVSLAIVHAVQAQAATALQVQPLLQHVAFPRSLPMLALLPIACFLQCVASSCMPCSSC